MSVSRRKFLGGLAASACASTLPHSAFAYSGALNANSEGLRAGSPENQGPLLQSLLEKAARARIPVFLEPGRYRISDITLPAFAHLEAIPGTVQLSYGGGNHFIYSETAEQITLKGLGIDGGLLPTSIYADAAIHVNQVNNLTVLSCHITNTAGSGIHVTGSAGILERNRIDSAVGSAGFIGHNNTGLKISSNTIEDCANGGILVHRWERGQDNTIVSQNRIRRIAAVNGGTGQWGNGINTYLADGVIVNDNHVSDCAFSTIRSNSCSNIQITDNTCLRAGETSVYSEFAFEGAKITGNIIDGGATGVSMANFNEGGRMSICANNLIRNIHAKIPYEADGHIHGNGIYAEADTVINGNLVEAAENFGIILGWGPYLRNVIADSNIIRKARTGFCVSVVDGIGPVTIADNLMSDLSGHAIVGHHWNDPVTGDLLGTRPEKYKSLEIKGNRVDS